MGIQPAQRCNLFLLRFCPFPWQQLHQPQFLRQGQEQQRGALPPKDFNFNPTQLHTVRIPSPKSHLWHVSCLIPKTALRPQPPTPKQETPGKTFPPRSYNRAGFMLLLQALTPWNRVQRRSKQRNSFRKIQTARGPEKDASEQSGRQPGNHLLTPPQRLGVLEKLRQPGRVGVL